MDLVKSADRILDILELLAATGRYHTHAEIARRTGIPKSSLTALLRNLSRRGYVEAVAGSSAVRLGEGAFALARRGSNAQELVRIAQPHLVKLTRDGGESSSLSLLNDDMAERISNVESENANHYSMHIGVRAPLYAHSGGKIFLAWMPPAEREAYFLRTDFKALTRQTILSVPALRRQITQIRTKGFALSRGEFTPGIVGVAVPVLNVHGKVLCAIGVAMLAERFTELHAIRVVSCLKQCAQGIQADSMASDFAT